MNTLFAETLRKLRREKGFSQIQLADQMFVNKSTIARWENGSRLPDAAMITRLSRILGVDVGTLLSTAAESDKSLNIIIVDDNKAIIADSLFVLEEVVPTATITGFNWPQEAIEYAKVNTDACGFMVKPLTPEGVRRQLKKLRCSFSMGGSGE